MKKTEISFDDFWDFIIDPAIETCFKEIDLSFSTQANVQTRDPNEFRYEIEKTYKEKRAWLKAEYLPESDHPSLDFHKLSSILCRCFIGNKFFTYNTKKAEVLHNQKKRQSSVPHRKILAWEIDNIFVNYKLAFLVAQGVAFYDLIYWAQSRINADTKALLTVKDEDHEKDIKHRIAITEKFLNKLGAHEGLKPYLCSKTHDDFSSSIIVALMKNDCLMRDFDYLMFGAMMFQWQEYTKQCVFAELISGETEIFNSRLRFCLT